MELIDTKQAAQILNISTARVRILLKQGRIEGAYKIGKFWVIPLYNDRPFVKTRNRGPSPKWCNPRRPAKTNIKIDRHKIKGNTNKPVSEIEGVVSLSKKNKTYCCHELAIHGPCRIFYSLEPQKSKGGARVWIETLSEVEMFEKKFTVNDVSATQSIGFV